MNADVSRALATFIASMNLSRETARDLAARFVDVDDVADLPEWIREVDDDAEDPTLDEIHAMATEDEVGRATPMDPEQRARALALLGVTRALGHDVTPGHDQLHHWWTKGPGLARWIGSKHQFGTLRDQLVEEAHVTPEVASKWAAAWVHEVTGFWPGSDMHRVLEGDKPRGHRIGPG